MGVLNLDLTGVASAGKPLPEGPYEFLIEDAVVVPAKDNQSHNLKLTLTVSSDEENGRKHTENINLQEKTKPFVKAFLAALWGLEDDDITDIEFDIDDEDNTVNSINNRAITGEAIGGNIKHVTSGSSVYGNVNGWFTV